MTQLITGATLLVSGGVNLAILSEIISGLNFDTFRALCADTMITEEQYDSFIGSIGGTMIEAGLLTEELAATNCIAIKQKLV